jgi:hypothetical protein
MSQPENKTIPLSPQDALRYRDKGHQVLDTLESMQESIAGADRLQADLVHLITNAAGYDWGDGPASDAPMRLGAEHLRRVGEKLVEASALVETWCDAIADVRGRVLS